MGNCVSTNVKYPDEVVLATTFNPRVGNNLSDFERRCDEIGTEILGIPPRAPVVSI
jgi:hypothetical protein